MKFKYNQTLSRTIINHYKRHDIFKCVHQSHVNFEHRVSVYHVLKEKQCYPEGCIYFNWRYRLLNKGKSCPRKFKHVGKNCFNCKDFYDEKEIFKPELLLSEEEYQIFIRKLNQFEDWLEELRGKDIEFSGIINSLKRLITGIINCLLMVSWLISKRAISTWIILTTLFTPKSAPECNIATTSVKVISYTSMVV